MKANSKRRVLVSSLSMLLVAAVSLGAATYAWFTSSTTSTANGISVRTIKSSELQISKLDKTWGTTVNYGQTTTQVYLPVSSADGVNWYTAIAKSKDAYVADDAIVATKQTGYYFAEQLNVRNKGEADVENATITFTLTDAVKPEYIRIALVPVTDTDDNTNTLPVPTGSDFMSNIYAEDTVAYKALIGTDVDADLSDDITPKNTYSVKLGNEGVLEAGTTEYYNLYVWFEGQDADCFDTNAGASLGDIQFTISGQTAEQV